MAPWAVTPLCALVEVHLAAAWRPPRSLGDDLDSLIAYDHRLLAAARTLGLPTEQPT